MKRDLLRPLAAILAITGLFSCATQNHSPSDSSRESGSDASLRLKEERPGLATGWGREKASSITGQSFVRASSKPAGMDVIYYNNKEGIEAMTSSLTRVEGMQTAAGSLVEWGMKGHSGFLDTYKEGNNGVLFTYPPLGRRLVVGDAGSNYRIVVRNRSRSTLEIVASVDGLDVVDGKAASFSKRGYLVAAGDMLEIEGFRTSNDSVAAFTFSSVANSYANLRHGDTRNVGVIGIAVFTQKGVNPWTWMPKEVRQRDQAQPFAQAP